MNEEESARIALGEPDEDSLARERARARLRTRFGGSAPRRTPRRRPVSVVSVVALIVGSLVLLTTLPGRDSAASALNRLRGLAIRLPTAQLGQGESLHLRIETMGPEAQTVVGTYES